MWLDAILAYLHFIAIFLLFSFMVTEAMMMRATLDAAAWEARAPSEARLHPIEWVQPPPAPPLHPTCWCEPNLDCWRSRCTIQSCGEN